MFHVKRDEMKTIINWKVFFILWIASVLSSVAILPYALTMQTSALNALELPLPLPVIVTVQIVQNAILLAITIFSGLWLARRLGLGAPILEAATRGEPVGQRIRAILPLSVILGVIGTLVILGLEFFLFQPAMLRELGNAADVLNLQTSQPAAWKGFLASFYGGIAEEVQLRLFFMTLLAWVGSFISRTTDAKPTSGGLWTANILAAILFGLGHLPAISTIIPITPLVIARTVTLNTLLGIAFGWLYWKRGLEAAIISHFSADLILHVLLAL
jgi:membrane protease YdiL (CAAX protease family)